jgi:glycosyltransferase involved in cell wall biosynthesis
MRILHLIHTLDPACGGTSEAVRQLAQAHATAGHQVVVASLDAAGSPFLAQLPCPAHALGPAHGRFGYAPALAPWLRTQLAGTDLVVVHGMWQYHGMAARKACRALRRPYVVYPHGMLDPWFKRHYPLKHLKKWLYWPWGDYRVLRDAAAVVFTTDEERLAARQSFWLYRAHERVASLGIEDPPQDSSRQQGAFLARFPALAGTRNLLFLGRLHAKKGCDLAIAAFAEVAAGDQRLRLVMAGPDSGSTRALLERDAAQRGIGERIVWTGLLQGDEKWGALRCAEAFLLPSHQENFGVAVIEALACRLPVLISNQVNVWRAIAEHRAGFVDADDAPGTARNLRAWCALDEPARQTMAAAARACFTARFEIGAAALHAAAVFREAIDGTRLAEAQTAQGALP